MDKNEVFQMYKKYHTPWGRVDYNKKRTERKIYRNEPCSCGSGKKVKNCCKVVTKYSLS